MELGRFMRIRRGQGCRGPFPALCLTCIFNALSQCLILMRIFPYLDGSSGHLSEKKSTP
jgi:hypothetical protein